MALATYTCASLKIFSYVHVNKTCRKLALQQERKSVNNEKIDGKTPLTNAKHLIFINLTKRFDTK